MHIAPNEQKKGSIIMIKIIDGKSYNTKTAEKLYHWENEFGYGDNHFMSEELYRKKSGEFFLVCEGGSATKYGHGYEMGLRVYPMTFEEAQRWAEKRLPGYEYVAIFGEPSENNGYITTGLVLSEAVMVKAQGASAAAGIHFSEYLEKLIMADTQPV